MLTSAMVNYDNKIPRFTRQANTTSNNYQTSPPPPPPPPEFLPLRLFTPYDFLPPYTIYKYEI